MRDAWYQLGGPPRVAPPHEIRDTSSQDVRPRFLSEVNGRDVMHRLARISKGGGYTAIRISSTWAGTLRWARNQISTAGEVRDNMVMVHRDIEGGIGNVFVNETTSPVLVAAARQAERIALQRPANPQHDLVTRLPLEPQERPQNFSEATYQIDAERRAATAVALVNTAAHAGMQSAGDITVTARSLAVFDTEDRVLYCQYTLAECRVTVRDPRGTGSGWAGVDHHDWGKIDSARIAEVALDKCLQSLNPVRVEPGRYTTILEPQAVGDFIGGLFDGPGDPMSLSANLYPSTIGIGPFNKTLSPIPYTLLGERVVDERVTIWSDPADPDLGFAPFNLLSDSARDIFTVPVYHPVTWIERGVLTRLSHNRTDGIAKGSNLGLPNSGAFRMSGGDTTVEEMIATTKRGVLVTRFDQPSLIDFTSQLYRGYTRDGLWLIENGKIAKPIKNLAFTESPLFALNSIEQLGVPQRVYHGGAISPYHVPQPRIVPALKVRDFSFTALTDAV